MPDPTSRRARRNPYAGLIHLLNRRYHDEWRRAEALREELHNLRESGFWKAVAWMRWVKQQLWPVSRHQPPPLALRAEPYIAPADLPAPCGLVSIIIPFKDRLELLRNCLRSLRRGSYPSYEVILVDNGSTEAHTARFLAQLRGKNRYKVVSNAADFNFSHLCNLGTLQAMGDYLLFLNNDTEVLSSGYLEDLIRLASDTRVGAAGGTLLYPDLTIQHAGLFPRMDGQWVHPYRGLPSDAPGDDSELRQVRSVPAVTAACLFIRRQLFLECGGFDERFPVAHNDVDLCERLRRKGLFILISPSARLIHYEGLSRGIGHD